MEPETETLELPEAETLGLCDGTSLVMRPPGPADADALLAFLQSISPEQGRLSFVAPGLDLQASASWAANPDGTDHLAVVAIDPGGKIIGHCACVRIYGRRAEVAVDVDEVHRYTELGSALLRRLARDTERQGIHTLIAEALP